MILVYGTPFCAYCKVAMDFFTSNKLEFKYIDVSEDDKCLAEMVRKSGQWGVPVIDIGGEIITGWNPNKVNEVLNEHRPS